MDNATAEKSLVKWQKWLGCPIVLALYPGSLPQLFKLSEIESFVTGKLHWNDTTEFPYGAFWWRSPDGTELFTVMSPPNVEGVMDTHPITMTNYAVKWQKQTGFQDSLWVARRRRPWRRPHPRYVGGKSALAAISLFPAGQIYDSTELSFWFETASHRGWQGRPTDLG